MTAVLVDPRGYLRCWRLSGCAFHGGVLDPVTFTDSAEGPFIVNPSMNFLEHTDAPSFARIDTERSDL